MPSEASVHLFRETFECRQIFPLTCPAHARGKISNINKALLGLLLSLVFTYLMKSDKCQLPQSRAPESAWGYCHGHTKGIPLGKGNQGVPSSPWFPTHPTK